VLGFNWVQYQINLGIEIGNDTNYIVVWMLKSRRGARCEEKGGATREEQVAEEHRASEASRAEERHLGASRRRKTVGG
jgi:hypothetical protein